MIIVLDRDGVINLDRKDFVKTPEEWIAIPNSLSAIAKLNHAGFKVVISTNQSGIARGLFNLDDLNQIHQKMLACLSVVGGHIDAIYYCPHHPDHDCDCRKPKPGMLKQIADDFKIDLTKDAVVIGDSWRDIQAAIAVNCPAILVRTGNGQATLNEHKPTHIPVFEDLDAAVTDLLSLKK